MTNTERQNERDQIRAVNLLLSGIDRAIAAIPEELDQYLRMLPGQSDQAVELAAEAHFLRQYIAQQRERIRGRRHEPAN